MRRSLGFALLALIAFGLIQFLCPQLNAQSRVQPQNGACFYMDANYRGQSYCIDGNENQSSVGGYNDRISSIRIFGNAEVIVYEDSNFNGASRTISQDMPHLDAWNDGSAPSRALRGACLEACPEDRPQYHREGRNPVMEPVSIRMQITGVRVSASTAMKVNPVWEDTTTGFRLSGSLEMQN